MMTYRSRYLSVFMMVCILVLTLGWGDNVSRVNAQSTDEAVTEPAPEPTVLPTIVPLTASELQTPAPTPPHWVRLFLIVMVVVTTGIVLYRGMLYLSHRDGNIH